MFFSIILNSLIFSISDSCNDIKGYWEYQTIILHQTYKQNYTGFEYLYRNNTSYPTGVPVIFSLPVLTLKLRLFYTKLNHQKCLQTFYMMNTLSYVEKHTYTYIIYIAWDWNVVHKISQNSCHKSKCTQETS